MAKLSIIVPSYNHAKFLKDRLDSIQSQTFKDWELIIIDDCSTDESVVILEDFATKNKNKVKYFIKNKTNSGSGYSSWKKGIALAETEYIWIAETDDYCKPTFLEEMVSILDKNKGIAFSFCGSNYVDEHKRILYDSTNRTKDLEVPSDSFNIFDAAIFLDRMPFNTYITNGSSVVFRRPIEKISEELFSYKQISDIFLWTYLIRNKRFSFLNKNLNYFRRHENSTTTKILKFRQESVYYEIANYLNLFNQTFKYKIFIHHYIKHYIWSHKKDVFNTKPLELIKNVRFKFVTYYFQLVIFVLNRIYQKF